MPEPQGEELQAIRHRQEELKQRYLLPAGERPRTASRGIHHAAFICRDVEETILFYRDVMGFPLVDLFENRDYAGSTHFFLDIGNENLLAFFDFPGHPHPSARSPSAEGITWPCRSPTTTSLRSGAVCRNAASRSWRSRADMPRTCTWPTPTA
ncbi:VOC family protein [Streptomyces sp. NPDC058964]|uniref:VOC family protein n=1 Tax=Streptomyces sp. NPDC058964 TaxID=3346681 RepID=UPI0036836FDF